MENIFDKPRIFLGLGSNLGDREANLRDAIERLETCGLEIVNTSSIYETEPVGYAEQGDFLNQVVEVRFTKERFPAEALLRATLKIEAEMGRHRTFQNAPRVIDIDLLLYGEMVLAQTADKDTATIELFIPHPRMIERRFVLAPLNEIAPEVRHPSSKKTIAQLLAECTDDSVVRLYKKL